MPIPTPGRMLRRSICNSRKIAALSDRSLRLWVYIIPWFNSHGKLNGEAAYIKGECCPLDSKLTIKNIPPLLKEISQKTNIIWFKRNGRWYLQSKSFKKHQELEWSKVGADHLPSYDDKKSTTTRREVADKSTTSRRGVVHEVKGKVEGEVKGEVEGKEGENGSSPTLPTNNSNSAEPEPLVKQDLPDIVFKKGRLVMSKAISQEKKMREIDKLKNWQKENGLI